MTSADRDVVARQRGHGGVVAGRRAAPLRFAVAAVVIAVAGLPAAAEEASLGVSDAYATTAYPGAPTGAIYLVLHNLGLPDDRLTGVSSPAAASVTLHSTSEAGDGVMRMRGVEDGLPLPRDGELTLSPGGLHIMAMGLTAPWVIGDEVPLTLTFASGATLEVIAKVAPAGAGGHDRGTQGHAEDAVPAASGN